MYLQNVFNFCTFVLFLNYSFLCGTMSLSQLNIKDRAISLDTVKINDSDGRRKRASLFYKFVLDGEKRELGIIKSNSNCIHQTRTRNETRHMIDLFCADLE